MGGEGGTLEEFPRLAGEGAALEEFPRLAREGAAEGLGETSGEGGNLEDEDATDKFLFWGLPATAAEGGERERQSLIERAKASWATTHRPDARAKPFDKGARPAPAAEGEGSGGGSSSGGRLSPPGTRPAPASTGDLLDFEKAEGGCLICCCDRPAYPACFVPCGHAAMCYGCALDSAISLSGTCPLCRAKATAIVTYEPLELLQLPKSELLGLQAMRRGAGGAILLPRAHASANAAANGAASGGAAEPTRGDDGDEFALCWVARVTGPTGALLNSLTAEDLARTEGR